MSLKGVSVLWVDVPAKLAAKLYLRWARHDQGRTQAQLAVRAHVSPQMIAKMEKPDYNPTIETLEKVAKALGTRLLLSLERPQQDSVGARTSPREPAHV